MQKRPTKVTETTKPKKINKKVKIAEPVVADELKSDYETNKCNEPGKEYDKECNCVCARV